MLKKAGIVVLGATAGMLSLAPLASAGEDPSGGRDNGHHHEHDGGHRGGGDCDKAAISQGDRLISLDNVASNATITDVNVLAVDRGDDGHCGGGGDRDGRDGRDGRHGSRDGHGHGDGHGRDGGDSRKLAYSSGDRLISADNLLANADVSDLNVLSFDG